MQFFVCTRRFADWRVDVMMNSRRVTLEQQLFADDFALLAPAEQLVVKSRVSELVAPLPSRAPS
jgi:hypothetical protein